LRFGLAEMLHIFNKSRAFRQYTFSTTSPGNAMPRNLGSTGSPSPGL